MAVEAQLVLHRLLLRVDPVTKDQQKIRERSDNIAIISSTNATPSVVTTLAHGLKTGDKVFIHTHSTNTAINNTLANPAWTITVPSTTTLSLDGSVGNGAGGATGSVVPAYVGSVDGDVKTREQHLDLLNQARWVVMGVVVSAFKKDPRGIDPERLLPGWVVRNATFQFASGSATKPTGYVDTVKLHTAAGIRIPVYTPTEYEWVKNKLSATNPAVEDRGTILYDATAGTNVPNASDYVLNYLGLTDFTLGDILQISGYTNTTEPLDEERHELLYRAAVAIARGAGQVDLNTLIAKELGII